MTHFMSGLPAALQPNQFVIAPKGSIEQQTIQCSEKALQLCTKRWHLWKEPKCLPCRRGQNQAQNRFARLLSAIRICRIPRGKRNRPARDPAVVAGEGLQPEV